jgi:hypothetical protein
MLTLQSSLNGLEISTNKKKICAHHFPSVPKCLISCKQEIKKILDSQNTITYEFVKMLNDPKLRTSVRIPVTDGYLNLMIKNQSSACTTVKTELTSNNQSDFRDTFLVLMSEIIWNDRIASNDKVTNYLDIFNDSYRKVKGHCISVYKPTIKNEIFLISNFIKKALTDDILMPYTGRIRSYFMNSQSNSNLPDVGIRISDQTLSDSFFDFIKDVVNEEKLIVWATVLMIDNHNRNECTNEVLIKKSEGTITIIFIDPILKNEEEWKKYSFSTSTIKTRTMELLKKLVKHLKPEKKVIVNKKYICSTCENSDAFHFTKDLTAPMYSLYGLFMVAVYLRNQENKSIESDFSVDDDIVCFFSLLKDKFFVMLAIFCHGLCRENSDMEYNLAACIRKSLKIELESKAKAKNPSLFKLNYEKLMAFYELWEVTEKQKLFDLENSVFPH